MRATGYYWVKRNGTWEIGDWYLHMNGTSGFWVMFDDKKSYQDADFEEIDENQIIR